jgi:choline dehydrogenase-like flavoprotein
MASDAFDVCVIGTGAGGGVMIDELTAAGFSVVALERGPQLGPADFAKHDEISNQVRGTGFAPDLVETLRPDESSPARPARTSMLVHGVGGGTLHWGAWSWRLRRDDFEVLTREGSVPGADLADWPIGYDELEPHYTRAERAYGVAGNAGSNPVEVPRAEPYPNPPHPYRSASLHLERGAGALGWTPFPSPLAVNSRPYGGRSACMNGGRCSAFGCPVLAKAGAHSVHVAKAQLTGRLDLRANARAREILLDARGRARGVAYLTRDGREQELRARAVIVSAGSLGSAQLLLLSKSGSFPQGLANSSGLVGRHLMFHTLSYVNFDAEERSHSALGPPGQLAVDDLHASDARRGFIRGAVMTEANEPSPIHYALGAAHALGTGTRPWGAALKQHLRRFPWLHGLITIGEDLPVASNRVDLDPDLTDAWGLPALRITHASHPNDRALHAWYEARLLEWAAASGARRAWTVPYGGIKGGSGHLLGTARMGDDPDHSVLDRHCRSHDVPNLWVVDGSCFPTAAGYNPTLTIVANAYRVARHFVAAARRQDLA